MSSDEDESMRVEENAGPGESDVVGETDDDTLRIMVCTDNHLGYCESDPIRGLDSFAAFEEILFLAKHFKCDMVLIAGDLFHDNKPSRRTLHKTMDIIRRYTMGPDPVKIQILSDQAKNFRSNKRVNYEEEFYSVDLPIFSIHGNHDDPTRVDGGTEMLAALDLLAVSNLVNYFGRQDEVEKVEVSPVLLQKGTTRVALYGMGSMRDERLHRMWVGKKVRFLRPADQEKDDEDKDDDDDDDDGNKWFNIFALHQNRDLGRGSKNCVHESMIPEWMDLVVWGHEHECRIEPGESVIGTFRISQPGSSVATSLISGEAVRKHVGLLDIRNNQFRLKPIPLTQVRSFAMSEISLRELKDQLDPEDPKIDVKVTKVLEDEVKMVIREARQKTKDLLEDAKTMGNISGNGNLKYKLEKRDAVLVRVKVDHSGFTTLNNQRFGAKFVGHVANVSDILLFHRRKQDAKPEDTKAGAKKRGAAALSRPIAPGELENEIRVEDLVKENLDMADKKLEILNENRLTLALDEFVTKEQNRSIEDAMEVMLGAQQKKLFSGGGDEKESRAATVDEDALDVKTKKANDEDLEEVSRISEKDDDISSRNGAKKKRAPAPKTSTAPTKRGATARVASSRKKVSKVVDSDDDEIDDEDNDDFDQPAAKQSKRAAAKASVRPQRVTKVARKNYKAESDDNEEVSFQDDIMDEDSDLSDARSKKHPSRSAASAKKTKSTQLSFETTRRPRTTAAKAKQGTKRRADDDDDSKDNPRYGHSYDIDDDWGKANTETQS